MRASATTRNVLTLVESKQHSARGNAHCSPKCFLGDYRSGSSIPFDKEALVHHILSQSILIPGLSMHVTHTGLKVNRTLREAMFITACTSSVIFKLHYKLYGSHLDLAYSFLSTTSFSPYPLSHTVRHIIITDILAAASPTACYKLILVVAVNTDSL